MLSYNLKTIIDNLVRELHPYDYVRQRYLIRAILIELNDELGEQILEFFEEGCRDLRQNNV